MRRSILPKVTAPAGQKRSDGLGCVHSICCSSFPSASFKFFFLLLVTLSLRVLYFIMQFLPLSIAFVCFLATAQALHLAERVHQLSYNKRATYEGGWPLALTGADCPSDAPVACDTYSGSVNPVCCPNGQFCKGIDWPYCCPTSSYPHFVLRLELLLTK